MPESCMPMSCLTFNVFEQESEFASGQLGARDSGRRKIGVAVLIHDNFMCRERRA